MQNTQATNNPTFTPTQEMLQAAANVFLCMAMVGTIRPIVVGYQRKILAEGQWKIRNDLSERIAGEAGRVILEPEESFMMSDEDFAIYNAKCQQAQKDHGLSVQTEGHCALLEAEHMLIKAQHALIEVMAPVTKIAPDKLLHMEDRKAVLDLTLKLMSPYVEQERQKYTARSPLTFLTVQGHTIGVKAYQGTSQECEVILLAVQSFSHLLKAEGLFCDLRHFTFAQFADLIAKVFDDKEPKIAETLDVLRRVHARHEQYGLQKFMAAEEEKRKQWIATLKEGDEVEVPYSLGAEDIIRMKVLSNNGGTIRLLPVGCVDSSENWIKADSHAGWTIPYCIKLVPPGTTIPMNTSYEVQ